MQKPSGFLVQSPLFITQSTAMICVDCFYGGSIFNFAPVYICKYTLNEKKCQTFFRKKIRKRQFEKKDEKPRHTRKYAKKRYIHPKRGDSAGSTPAQPPMSPLIRGVKRGDSERSNPLNPPYQGILKKFWIFSATCTSALLAGASGYLST